MAFLADIKGLTRNPLGIIALFISLIYAMSALLLGYSVGSLSESNQTNLVYFIVLFPVLVLGVFSWLVSKHHSKLYGPGDYRSDESFINAGFSRPAEVGLRIRQEIEELTDNVPALPELSGDVPKEGGPEIAFDQAPSDDTVSPKKERSVSDQRVSDALALQSLILRELQGELNGSVINDAQVGNRFVDAIILTASGAIIVEVKNLYAKSLTVRSVHGWIKALEDIIDTSGNYGISATRGILAIVVRGGFPDSALTNLSLLSSTRVDLRFFDKAAIQSKYGVSAN